MKRLLVIGGGASGFFCAIHAALTNPDLQITIVEKSSKLLSKVRVSGGGRCNVTHACFEIDSMSRNYPRGGQFVKKTFHQFFTTDTIKWFADRKVTLKTEEDGRMFPDTDSSETIINCLIREVNQLGINILLNTDIKEITRLNEQWQLTDNNGKKLIADFICIASGGYPKSTMFDWLQNLGHSIEPPVPSLFTFNIPGNDITELMGITVPDTRIRIRQTKLDQRGPLLITHWGLSGPAVLKLSAWGARILKEKNYDFQVAVSWIAELGEEQLRERFKQYRYELASQKIGSRNPFQLPQRLWDYLLRLSFINPSVRWADLTVKDQNKLISNLHVCEFNVRGKTTYKEEFVTAGGLPTSEIDPNTMMSRKQPNIFFAGEVIDVDGITGGFNFQHAWTSGYIAGKSIGNLSLGN